MKEVNVKFLSDTKGYVKGVEAAEKANDDLTKSIKASDDSQDKFNESVNLSKLSVDELGLSVKQTGEGAIDAATGMSGLGSAIMTIGESAVSAIRGLKGFQLALLATGVGAALAALTAMVVYWDDIKVAINGATDTLKKFNDVMNEEFAKTMEAFNTSIIERTLKAAGASMEEIRQFNLDYLNIQKEALTVQEESISRQVKQLQWMGKANAENEEYLRLIELQKDVKKELFNVTSELFILQNTEIPKNLDWLNRVKESMKDLGEDIEDALMIPPSVSANNLQYLNDLVRANEETARKLNDIWAVYEYEQEQATASALASDEKYWQAQTKMDNDIYNSKVSTMNSLFALSTTLSEKQQAVQGGIMVSQAIANGALAVTQVLSDPTVLAPAKPFVIAAVLASVAAQIGTIVSQTKASLSGGSIDGNYQTVERASIETALPNLPQQNQYTPVLVTDDFNKVNDRVIVTNERTSIA